MSKLVKDANNILEKASTGKASETEIDNQIRISQSHAESRSKKNIKTLEQQRILTGNDKRKYIDIVTFNDGVVKHYHVGTDKIIDGAWKNLFNRGIDVKQFELCPKHIPPKRG